MDTNTKPVIRCPHCHDEIDCLNYASDATHYYDVYIVDSSLEYEEQDINFSNFGPPPFTCPNCGKVITESESDALAFLKTGNLPSEGDKALAAQAAEVTTP